MQRDGDGGWPGLVRLLGQMQALSFRRYRHRAAILLYLFVLQARQPKLKVRHLAGVSLGPPYRISKCSVSPLWHRLSHISFAYLARISASGIALWCSSPTANPPRARPSPPGLCGLGLRARVICVHAACTERSEDGSLPLGLPDKGDGARGWLETGCRMLDAGC